MSRSLIIYTMVFAAGLNGLQVHQVVLLCEKPRKCLKEECTASAGQFMQEGKERKKEKKKNKEKKKKKKSRIAKGCSL